MDPRSSERPNRARGSTVDTPGGPWSTVDRHGPRTPARGRPVISP
ncbi:Uncharacterised protein [Amycolatopsis camponoti]|uniref:Uncharacterized protein n=1 Tax=Amycolatopsis camponoti TaxID=2606593 RepID=A0A6I8M4U8_9PSEU|nr:Uncharacterised protein [Amycolatopsis camponoti]